jgi:hypothetical protein
VILGKCRETRLERRQKRSNSNDLHGVSLLQEQGGHCSIRARARLNGNLELSRRINIVRHSRRAEGGYRGSDGGDRLSARPRPSSIGGEDGPLVFAHACKLGLEGIVSKRKDSGYRSGRSPHWIKSKNPAAPAMRREAEEDWGR